MCRSREVVLKFDDEARFQSPNRDFVRIGYPQRRCRQPELRGAGDLRAGEPQPADKVWENGSASPAMRMVDGRFQLSDKTRTRLRAFRGQPRQISFRRHPPWLAYFTRTVRLRNGDRFYRTGLAGSTANSPFCPRRSSSGNACDVSPPNFGSSPFNSSSRTGALDPPSGAPALAVGPGRKSGKGRARRIGRLGSINLMRVFPRGGKQNHCEARTPHEERESDPQFSRAVHLPAVPRSAKILFAPRASYGCRKSNTRVACAARWGRLNVTGNRP